MTLSPNARVIRAVRENGLAGFWGLSESDRLRAAACWSCQAIVLEQVGERTAGVEDGRIVLSPLSVRITEDRWLFDPTKLAEGGWTSDAGV